MDNIDDAFKAILVRMEWLERGGCTCETPEWHFAWLISCYRCGNCGATVSARVLPDHLKPKDG